MRSGGLFQCHVYVWSVVYVYANIDNGEEQTQRTRVSMRKAPLSRLHAEGAQASQADGAATALAG